MPEFTSVKAPAESLVVAGEREWVARLCDAAKPLGYAPVAVTHPAELEALPGPPAVLMLCETTPGEASRWRAGALRLARQGAAVCVCLPGAGAAARRQWLRAGADWVTTAPGTEAEAHLGEWLADAQAVHAGRMSDAESDRRRVLRLRGLYELTATALQSPGLESLLLAITAGLRQHFGAVMAEIWLAEPASNPVRLRYAAGENGANPYLDELRLLPIAADGRAAVQRIAFAQKAVRFNDLTVAQPTVYRPGLALSLGYGAFAGFPLMYQETVQGVLTMFTAQPIGDDDYTMLSNLAPQAAVAIASARLQEDLRVSYSSLKNAHGELVRRERLAALGEMSAILAHEFRNPLGVIFNALTPLRKYLPPGREPELLWDIVKEEAERLNHLVGDLLEFARPFEANLGLVSPGDLVREAIDGIRPEHKADPAPSVVADVPPETPKLPIDAGKFVMALTNLIDNACAADPHQGPVVVRVRHRPAPGGGDVTFQVQDQGCGMSAEVRRRAFDPFFSTRASGTGLGLPLVRKIVSAHGGELICESWPGKGTTMTVVVPVLASQETAAAHDSGNREAARQGAA